MRPADGSRMALIVEKTGLYSGKKHLFLFEKYQGALQFDAQHPEQSSMNLVIESGSLVCKDTWINAKDLRKVTETALDDMLAAKRFPSMTFQSQSIRMTEPNRFEAKGTLEIRGMARPVTVLVQLAASNPAMLRIEGSAKVFITHYGLKPPSAVLGAIGTKDEMRFAFQLSAEPAGL